MLRTESDELFGEEGYTTLERLWARPTLDVMVCGVDYR